MDAHQTSVYAFVAISSIILGTIILYFIASIIHHHRRTHALYKRSLEAEITTLEKERSRMAADLHDELGPVLSAIKYKIGSLDTLSQDDEETVEDVNKYIDTLVRRMREISNDLMPNILIHKGVVFALHDFIDNISEPGSLQIHFAHQDIPELSESQSIHIYRIVLEIIHNTIKHAGASDLKIEFKKLNGALLLQSKDNGQGFEYNIASRKIKRLGLRNIAARAGMLAASLLIETSPGKGTAFIIKIPYN